MSTGSGVPRSVRPAGARALLVEAEGLDDVLALRAHLTEHPLTGQTDVLAAASTVLVGFATPQAARAAAGRIAALAPAAPERSEAAEIEIDVVYDGEDLAAVAELCGMSTDALIDAHTSAAWVGAFGGFAPGFTYCTADPAPADVPRRTSPRTSVPAGSVAVAGRFSAVYPRASPGGWQLLGRTGATLWDLDRERPALIRPGDAVRYRAVRDLVTATGPARGPVVEETDVDGSVVPERALVVREPGMLTLIQDAGRPGHGDLGVPASGAADPAAAAAANAAVGNGIGAAVLEVLLGGLSLTARGHHVLALAGAPAPATITGTDGARAAAPHGRAVPLYDGQTLALEAPAEGLRTYLAVRGGITVPATLGSRSTDTLSGLGPAALRPDDVLPVGPAAGLPVVPHPAAEPSRPLPAPGAVTELRAVRGPRDDWFDQAGIDALTAQEWVVTPRSDRVGVRIAPADGARTITRARDGELPSEGVVTGSLQVPPSGEPVLFLADHPVTGGYPIIAVVREEDLALAAQAPPGARLRIRLEDPRPTAHAPSSGGPS